MEFQDALTELDRKLGEHGLRLDLVICGAFAIQLLGYSQRATEDIDSLKAITQHQVLLLIEEVGKDLGLKKNWINDQASTVSMPEGTLSRASSLNLWKNISAAVISRQDLICTKASAFTTRRDFTLKDLDDLIAMKPDLVEMETAIEFIRRVNSPPADATEQIREEFDESIEDLRKIARHSK